MCQAVSKEKILKHFLHRVLCQIYVSWCWRSWLVSGVIGYNHPKTIPWKFDPNWPNIFTEDFFADFFRFSQGSHLGGRLGSSDMLLKGDHHSYQVRSKLTQWFQRRRYNVKKLRRSDGQWKQYVTWPFGPEKQTKRNEKRKHLNGWQVIYVKHVSQHWNSHFSNIFEE